MSANHFSENEGRDVSEENVGALYIDGAAVKSGLPKNIISDDLYVGDNYRLTLPRKVIENGKQVYIHIYYNAQL